MHNHSWQNVPLPSERVPSFRVDWEVYDDTMQRLRKKVKQVDKPGHCQVPHADCRVNWRHSGFAKEE